MNLAGALGLRMARRFARGRAGRLGLTIVALAAGVSLICALDLVSRAVLAAFVGVVDNVAGRAALTVSAAGAPIAESLAGDLSAVPGVELAVPSVTGSAFMTDGSGELLTVRGVDVANEAAVRVYEARDKGGLEMDDPLVFLSQPDSIVLTRSFAAQRGLGIDDHLDLLTPTGRRTFIVRGLLEPTGIGRAYGGNLVVMDLAAAEAAFLRPDFVDAIDIVVRRDADVAVVAAALAHHLPPGLRVEPPSQRKADLQRVMQSLQVMLDAVSLLGLAAAFLIIFNRLATVFEARAWQLGILRAIGMRPRVLWWELVKESVLLGLVGVAIGIPLGIAAGHWLLPVVATTAALNFKLIATDATLAIGAGPIVTAAALGVGTAVLAAAIPAWRVADRPPIETIRARGVSPRGKVRWHWPLRAAVVVAVLATLVVQSVTRVSAWGLVATGLLMVVTVLAARPVLDRAAPALLRVLCGIAGSSAELARGAFARNSARAVLTIAMIGVGLGTIIWARILAYSFETSLVHTLSAALQGDWVVTSSHLAHGYLEAPVDEQLVSDVQGIEGVGVAAGERLVDWHYTDGPIAIDAFDPAYFATTTLGRWPLIGSSQSDVWSALARGTAILISSSFAVNLGVGVGHTLALDTPKGALRVPVAGITANFSSPRGTVIMSRALYREHWSDPQINRVFVRAAAGSDARAVRSAIARQLGVTYGLRIVPATELIEYFAVQVRRAFAPLDVLAALLLFVLLLGLADTLAANVLERSGELAVTRMLGARRAVVRRAVMVEGIALGLPGVLLAIVTGTLLGAVWVRQTFPLLLGWALETHVPYKQVAMVCGAALLVSWLAGLVPARRASRLAPAALLRAE